MSLGSFHDNIVKKSSTSIPSIHSIETSDDVLGTKLTLAAHYEAPSLDTFLSAENFFSIQSTWEKIVLIFIHSSAFISTPGLCAYWILKYIMNYYAAIRGVEVVIITVSVCCLL